MPIIVTDEYTCTYTYIDPTTGETFEVRMGEGNLTYAEVKFVQEKPRDGDQLLLDFND